METLYNMNEIRKYTIISKSLEGDITISKAAEELGLSDRQIKRLRKRVKDNGIDGVRLRSWDTCMSSLFTLEASGHNPRMGKADRLRNRVGHKFSYYPELHGGRFSCVGCGRCIKSCPSMVDIRQIVLDAVNEKEASNG